MGGALDSVDGAAVVLLVTTCPVALVLTQTLSTLAHHRRRFDLDGILASETLLLPTLLQVTLQL